MRIQLTKPSYLVALLAFVTLALIAGLAGAQDRPASPPAEASTQIGDSWITVKYSGPILRGRGGIFGEGDEFGKKVLAGGPVWRAGANATTEITSDVDLMFGETKLPAGTYRVLIDLRSPTDWHFIVTSKPAMATFKGRDAIGPELWGAYGYAGEGDDVLRAPMTVQPGSMSIDQLTYFFHDVTADGGNLAIAWDTMIASVPFKIAK
ncbi:MAG: DUF2911 domain-containing protein [Acidobacteriota bacterium]